MALRQAPRRILSQTNSLYSLISLQPRLYSTMEQNTTESVERRHSKLYAQEMQLKARRRRNIIYATTVVLLGVSLVYVYNTSQEQVINHLQKREYGTQSQESQSHRTNIEGAVTLRDHIAVSKRRIVEIEICHGDLTDEPTDAIVNAGN